MLRIKMNTSEARLASIGLIVVLLPISTCRWVFAQVPRLPDGVLGGTVSAVTPEQAAISTIAHEPFTIVFAPSTTFFKQVDTSTRMVPAKVTDIQVGSTINVFGHLDPDGITKHTKNVMIVTAETSQRLLAHGGVGISEVSGMVQEIAGSKLKIARYDNVTQVIEVNQETLFFKGSSPAAMTAQLFGTTTANPHAGLEATTLSEIKVGDILYTVGALKFPSTTPLKDNVFVASKAAVMPHSDRVIPDTPPKK